MNAFDGMGWELSGFGSWFLSLVLYAILGMGLGSTVWCGLVGWVRLQLAFYLYHFWVGVLGRGLDKAAGGNLDGTGAGEKGAGMAVVVPGFKFMGRYSLGCLDTKLCVVLLHLPLGGFRGLLHSALSQQ